MVQRPNLLALGTTWLERINGGDILGSWWAYCELGWGGWWFWVRWKTPLYYPGFLPLRCCTVIPDTPAGDFPPLVAVAGDSYLMLSLLGTLIVRSGILVSVLRSHWITSAPCRCSACLH